MERKEGKANTNREKDRKNQHRGSAKGNFQIAKSTKNTKETYPQIPTPNKTRKTHQNGKKRKERKEKGPTTQRNMKRNFTPKKP